MLNVKIEERAIVSILFLQSFLIGLSITFLLSSVNSLFLSNFSAKLLPYVYSTTAIVIPLIGFTYRKLQKIFKIEEIFKYIVIAIFILIFTLHLILIFTDFKWVYFAFMVVLEISIVYLNIQFWGLVGGILDIRQSKRLMGLIVSGQELAAVIGGFSMPFIVRLIGTENLFFIVEFAICCIFLILVYILKSNKITSQETKYDTKEKSSFIQDLKERYIFLLYLLVILGSISYYFVDFMFFQMISIKYPTQQELTSFIGIFFATAGVINFILTSMVSGIYLSRFGVLVALLTLPTLVSIGNSSILLSSIFLGSIIFLIPLAIFTKMLYSTANASINKATIKMLYQVFSTEKRLDVQSKIESFIMPITGGIIGILLMSLTSIFSFDIVDLASILLFVLVGWFFVVIYIKKEYTNYLLKALSKRSIEGHIEFDSNTMNIIKRGLNSKYPAEILYSFSLLERFDRDIFTKSIKEFVDEFSKYEFQIQEYLLEKIEEFKIDLRDEILNLINLEDNLEKKGKLIKTFSTIAEDDGIDILKNFLDTEEKILQKYSIVGLIKNSGITGVLIAGEKFNQFLNSKEPSDRIIACEILGEIAISNFHQPLVILLQDINLEVRRSALITTTKIKNPKLWGYILPNIHIKELYSQCANALILGQDEALEHLEREFYKIDITTNSLIRIIKIIGKIRSEKAKKLLIQNLDYLDEDVYFEIVNSLSLITFQADENQKIVIKDKIKNEIKNTIWIMRSIEDLKTIDDPKRTLLNALEYQVIKNKNRLLNLLSLIYPKETILKVKFNINQDNPIKKAYAFELLDNILDIDIKANIFNILEDSSMADKLIKFKIKFSSLNIDERVIELTKQDTKISNWVKCTLIYTIGIKRINKASFYLKKSLLVPNPMIKEIAIWSLLELGFDMKPDKYKVLMSDLDSDTKEALKYLKGKHMLLILEKVMILKSVSIFQTTPEEHLAEMTYYLDDVRIKNGEMVFKKGDIGTSMYIIVDGEVRVHDGDITFATLGNRTIFGELAALDPEPRTASITATKDTHLFKLEQKALYELMSENSDISKGIFHVLCNRLREANRK